MKLVLNDVGSPADSTMVNTINGNSEAIETAFENTLSRDGTSPNQMEAALDMNSNRILNLPSPISPNEPARLRDVTGTAVLSPLPTGGTTGQLLVKNSNADYDVSWAGSPASPSNATPVMDGTATPGVATVYARGDHVHPTDTSRAPLASPAFTGAPTAPTPVANDISTKLATTAFVNTAVTNQLSGMVSVLSIDPTIDTTGATDTSAKLQTAISTIASSSKIVYVPAGTYNLSNANINIADNVRIILAPNAILRRTLDVVGGAGGIPYTDQNTCLVQMGNSAHWIGGHLDNTAVAATSSSSNTISVGVGVTKTFTGVVSVSPWVANTTFLRIYSRSNPSAYFEGTVNSYSGTTLVLNAQFGNGTGGTYSDWDIVYGSVYQTAIIVHAKSKAIIEDLYVTNKFYCGIVLEAYTPTTSTNACTVKNCFVENVLNRAIYQYGNASDNILLGNYVQGNQNTDYAFNFNPANVGASTYSQTRTRIIGNTVINCNFQGFALSDQCSYNVIDSCTVAALTNPASVAFVIQFANTHACLYNQITNCVAQNSNGIGFGIHGGLFNTITGCSAVACITGFTSNTVGGQTPQYNTFGNCTAISNTNGFLVTGNSLDISLINILAVNNTTVGVEIDSGCSNTFVIGRATANGTNQIDNGTNTDKLLLKVV